MIPRTSLDTPVAGSALFLQGSTKEEGSQYGPHIRADFQEDEISTHTTMELSSPSSSFLPQSPFGSEHEEDGDVGFFIEGEDEEIPGRPAVYASKEPPETLSAVLLPMRPILKASVDENIPICTKKKSWGKLPTPDLQVVYMKRVASLNSFFNLESLDSVASADGNATLRKVDSKVNFQNVVVREYQQTIGDNPSVTYGTPISLDWDYEQNEPLDLNVYEAGRGGRRSMRQMFLNHYQRKNTLIHKCGFSEEEVKAAKYRTNKVRSQREASKLIQRSFRPLVVLEEMKESAVRKCKRRIDGHRSQPNLLSSSL